MARPHQALSLRRAGLGVFLAVILAGCPASSGDDPPSSSASSTTGETGETDPGDEDPEVGDNEETDAAEVGSPENDGGAEAADNNADGRLAKRDAPLPPEFEGAITLMTVGDSITMGRSDRPSWRYPFQELFRAGECPIDMVGTEDRWADGVPTGRYADFDHDHQAVGGRTTLQSAQAVIPVAPAFQADAVMIHTGTNDLTKGVSIESAESELRRMVRALAEANPDAWIFLAEIIPAGPALTPETAEWNERVKDLADEFASNGVDVETVDMFDSWDYRTMTVEEDNIHPNQRGAERLANRWYEALTDAGVC